MTSDRVYTQAELLHTPTMGEWCRDNVWYPMVNGSGVLQVYNTFAPTAVELPHAPPATTFSRDWTVQTLAHVGGAILPYLAAGKLMGAGMRGLGDKVGAQGVAGRFLASESAAMVLGAGAYDFLKKPNQGETRVSNAMASMAAFGAFEGGNHLLGKATAGVTNNIAKSALLGVGRFGVGAVGGVVSYETSTGLAGAFGEKVDRNWDNRWNSIATSGFINFALPIVRRGTNNLIDTVLNENPKGRGVPIDRYLERERLNDPELQRLAEENALVRVKGTEGETLASVDRNVVELGRGETPGKLGHELKYLRLAREFEPKYQEVAKLLKDDPVRAEAEYMKMRAEIESQARGTENRIQSRTSSNGPRAVESPTLLGGERASNGLTYNEIWSQQWRAFKQNPNFRPLLEFSGEPVAKPADAAGKPTETTLGAKPTEVTLDKLVGRSEPLGATVTAEGINFAIESKGATKIELLLFESPTAKEPSQVIALNRTGDTWHRFVPELKPGQTYLYRAEGPFDPAGTGQRFAQGKVLMDPYAKATTGEFDPTKTDAFGYDNSNPANPDRHLNPSSKPNHAEMPKAIAMKLGEFDWQGLPRPNHPMTDSIIYEMHLRGFTQLAPDLAPNLRGTYRGLVEQIPYLKKLGVTAVELLPIMQFDAVEGPRFDPVTGKQLVNDWGYNTTAYQAPRGRYAADGHHGQQVNEFKHMVRELRRNGIETVMDVVFNHTREGDHLGPTVSFRGLDNNIYYLTKDGKPALYADHTGCGNTVNANHPRVQKWILDTLDYWHNEMGVDGFRFDLASTFNFDAAGKHQEKTPIIRAIETDPRLASAKLIAEPWSISNYRVGVFSDARWSEWNGTYRDTVRRFMKGDSGQVATLADRIAGSPKWYDSATGRFSINFVTAHDGYTMRDLVSYQEKHNHRNGEGNRDGSNDNFSWNHGHEGPVDTANMPPAAKAAIEALRLQQMKNMMNIMMMSQGTPMLLMGDEVARTQHGNNNTWVQPELNNFDWAAVQKSAEMLRFTQMDIAMRQRLGVGRRGPGSIVWHGTEPFKPDWGDHTRFLAWQYKGNESHPQPLYTAFNAFWEPIKVTLPPGQWLRLVDTSLPMGQDIVAPSSASQTGNTYTIQPRSSIVLEGIPDRK